MEIGKDQHQEAFMYNIDEDSRDDEEDEDENRFIISLDDLDVKEDSLDESDNCCKEQEDTRSAHCIADNRAISPPYSKSTLNAKSPNVIHADIIHEDADLQAKSFIFQSQKEPVSETFPHIIVKNGESKSFGEGNYPISSKYIGLDSTNKECNGSFKSKPSDGMIKHTGSVSVDTCNELPLALTDTELGQRLKAPVKNRTFMEFTPHENCSCIMCYQGRGIFNATSIPKAAKRKMSVSASQVPSKARKQTSVNSERYITTFSNAQSDCNRNSPISSQKVHVPSILHLQLLRNDSSPPVSQFVRSQLSQGVSAVASNSSMAAEPQKCSVNYSFPYSGRDVSSFKSTSSPGTPSMPLPVLIPKPSSHFSTTTCLTNSPSITSDLSLKDNVIAKCLNPTSSNAQMHPLASDKTHVVLINKSTAERQLTDLNGILQRATKVDLSKPGMALVHFKLPKSAITATSPSSFSLQSSKPSSHKNTETNTLHGLVKHHLINPSIPSGTKQSSLDETINRPTCTFQNSLTGVPRTPNLLSKPHFPHSLINGMSISGNSSVLPPPPPLQPCPSSTHLGASRSPDKNSNATNIDKHQTETIVLPLPKSENNKASPSLGTVKEDGLLLSPSLFTFSSSLELSPQKEIPLKNGFSNDVSNINRTTQYQQLFQNHLPACHPLPLPSSLSSSLSQPGISMKSPSITSSTCTIPMTTVSSTMNQQSLLHFSSTPSNLPQGESGTHSAFLQENQIRITSDIASIGNFNKCDSSKKANSQWLSNLGWITIPPSPTTTASGSSVSMVSNMDGLKMKIRLKDKKSTETIVPSSGNEELQNSLPVKSSHNTAEARSFRSDVYPQDASKEKCASFSSEVSTNANVSVSNNSMETDNTSKAKSPIETAEEMFKRFEDQAMQEVYNAQFGVGEVQRNLRPNRTPFVTNDHFYSYTKVKTTSGEPSNVNQSGVGIQRKRAVKGKRRGSGDNKQTLPDEKQSKIDINQYPKLMQDNSILHRKTVLTPNILAGHKVFVKFNVFSNSQSGRSFLAPFFNIGGSRTQFDVEDMEYIKNAVVEYEKEEKSCARHLLFYSREGKKAVFLRKESGLHSNELTPKSYKKYSYILEGYKREKPKQIIQPSENWKVDSKVLIEIDRAEQDSEIDLQSCHTEDDHKSSTQTAVALRACGSPVACTSQKDLMLGATEDNSLSLSSPIIDLPNADKSCTQKPCEHSVDLQKTVNKTVSKECIYSHRNFVNILKKRKRFQKKDTTTNNFTASLSPVKKSLPVPESCNLKSTEQPKEPGASNNPDRIGSVPTPDTSFEKVSSGIKQDFLQDHMRANMSETASNIKTEVPDDGYDAALNVKGNNVNPTPEIPRLTIKSEPVDDYTESLAKSMNVSLQSNHTSGIESPIAFQKEGNVLDKLEGSPLVASTKVDNISETNVTVHPKAFSDLKEPLSAFNSINTTGDVSHSCSNISDDRIPSAESGCMEKSTSNAEELNKMAFSTEDETSEEEESDEDILPFISSMAHSGSTNTSAVLNSTNTNTPPANRKINSLVESLAQRLSQNNASLPPLFPTSFPPKKLKKKKEKTRQKHADLKENSLPSTSDVVKDVASHQSFAADVSQISLNPRITCSKAFTVPACGSITSTSRVDSKPLCSSHTASGSFSPLTSENSFNKMSGDVSEIRAPSVSCKRGEDQDKKKGSELLHSDVKEVSDKCESVTNDTNGISQFSANAVKSNESLCSFKPKIEVKDFSYERAYKLSGKIDNTQEIMTGKKHLEISDSDTFPMDAHSDDEIEIDNIFSQDEEGDHLNNHENESGLEPKSDSNCSTPCSEIDVGMDEVPVERSAKCEFVPFGTLLTSPPVPCKGKVYIKDFTREGELMVETGTKPEPNSHTQNVKSKRPSPPDFSTQTSRSENKAAKATSEDMKAGDPTQVDLKPSIASLLCKKLAIEMEPVIPKPVKANTAVFTDSKAFTWKEQQVPLISKTSYKPTLSAIFGVDDLSLPCLKEIKEKQTNSAPVVSTGKQRQVAVKGSRTLRRAKTSQKLKVGKQCGQEERQKNNIIRRTSPPTATGLRKQKFGLQSFFRTWRQLSHEERKKKEVKGIASQQFCTIPCKVVIERLEDMQLHTNGRPMKKESDIENPVHDFENKEKEERSLNLKKRRKRTSVKVQRRRQRKEKKDIVDYYASMLENLRKKAQMLEEVDFEKKESKAEKSTCEMESIIKVEPITFQDKFEPITFQTDSGSLISEEDGKKNLNMESETRIEMEEETLLQHVDNFGQDAEIDAYDEDALLGEDEYESVIDAASHNQDIGSVPKPPVCVQTSLLTNEFDVSGTTLGKEDENLPVNIDNHNKTEGLCNNSNSNTGSVISPAQRGHHEDDSKKDQETPTDITQSSTKNSLLSFSSHADIVSTRNEELLEYPAGTSNVDDVKIDSESRQTPDSSFKTKDIVLGFETEVVGDTDFSTTSQGDMEDLFLLDDGEEDSSMGMIPTEEVEKLLGLDLTSEGGFDTKQHKANSHKTSDLSSANPDGKLQWVPLPETIEKSKDLVDKEDPLPFQEIVPGSKQVQQDSPKHEVEESVSDALDPGNTPQSQQKKLQVSPSWNRLLGLEALRKMEKPVLTSSQPIVDRPNNLLPSSNHLKVKFDPGALSKALKLSAKMKRVFADGHSKEASDQHSPNVGRAMKDQSHECPSGTSGVNLIRTLSDIMTDPKVIGKDGGSMQRIQNVQVEEKGETDESTKFVAKAFVLVRNDNQDFNASETKVLQKETRKRSRSKSEQNVFGNDILENVSDSTQSDSDDCKANITGVSSNYDPPASLPNGLQTSSIDASSIEMPCKKTSYSEASPAVRTSHVRGIDLNKLKLKLNPLLSATKGAQSAISNSKTNVKIHSLSSKVLNDKTEDKNVTVSEKNYVPDTHLESAEGHHSRRTPEICSSQEENASHDESSKTKDSNMNQLVKQRSESEPMLNTVKLCNILKNVLKPNSLHKSIKSPSSSKTFSSQIHSSMKSKNKRRLRSSPKSIKSSKDSSNCGMPVDSLPLSTANEVQKDEKKNVEEERTERSFFDCLPGAISGAWENS